MLSIGFFSLAGLTSNQGSFPSPESRERGHYSLSSRGIDRFLSAPPSKDDTNSHFDSPHFSCRPLERFAPAPAWAGNDSQLIRLTWTENEA